MWWKLSRKGSGNNPYWRRSSRRQPGWVKSTWVCWLDGPEPEPEPDPDGKGVDELKLMMDSILSVEVVVDLWCVSEGNTEKCGWLTDIEGVV